MRLAEDENHQKSRPMRGSGAQRQYIIAEKMDLETETSLPGEYEDIEAIRATVVVG